MDLAQTSLTLACSKERVDLSGFTLPAETTPAAQFLTFFFSLTKDSHDICKLFEVFLLGIHKEGVGAVTKLLFDFISCLKCSRSLCVADLLDGELNAANFQNVMLLNLVVNFLLLAFKAANDQEH